MYVCVCKLLVRKTYIPLYSLPNYPHEKTSSAANVLCYIFCTFSFFCNFVFCLNHFCFGSENRTKHSSVFLYAYISVPLIYFQMKITGYNKLLLIIFLSQNITKPQRFFSSYFDINCMSSTQYCTFYDNYFLH